MKMIRRVAILAMAFFMLTSLVSAGEAAEQSFQATKQPQEVEAPTPVQGVEEDWRLLLVNPWNSIPEGYTVKLKRLSNGLEVDERIFEDLENMVVDCREAGLKPIICSAYRTEATQQRLHNNKIARLRAAGYSRKAALKEAARWVAVPGTSEHQTGMAVDIISSSYQVLDKKQEKTAEQKWLMEHCWEYGFILRFPEGKGEITGIGYEPWHYRYVGREAALAMRDNDLCMEEYFEYLEYQQYIKQTAGTKSARA